MDQLSRETQACLRGPAVSYSSPGRLVLLSKGPCRPPDIQGDLGPCSSARTVDQLSWVTRACVRFPVV